MKKTFQLTHSKIKPARLIEAVRRDVKKYLKREKRNTMRIRMLKQRKFNIWTRVLTILQQYYFSRV